MTKLDRYIIKRFLGTFFFILGLLMMIAIVFDITEKLDDFLRTSPPLKAIIVDYYVNFVFFYGNLFSPFLIFLSVIWFTSQMANRSEIIAIINAGVSFNRLLRPFFVAATMLAFMSLLLNHFIVPYASDKRINFEDTYIRRSKSKVNTKIHKQIKPNEFVYLENFNSDKNRGYQFTYEVFEGDELVWKMMGNFIVYDSVENTWQVRNYIIRELNADDQEVLIEGNELDTNFLFEPSDFARGLTDPTRINSLELREFIAEQTLRGSEAVPYYEIELHQRSSYPFATYILTLIGVSFASRKVRGGIGLNLAVSIAISAIYILAMQVTKVYATNAGLNPFFAVWLPNILFAFLAIYFYVRAPK